LSVAYESEINQPITAISLTYSDAYAPRFRTVVLNLGSIEPLGFDGAVSGVRRRSSETWL